MSNDFIIGINRLRKEKKAVIMAHYYQPKDIQDIADMVGDSLALAQYAAKTTADIILMCGVHFMGETAKILSPEKKVIVPSLSAGCSLADSCDADDLAEFIKEHPDHKVISYVNTTASVKALTDIVVTSTNAKKIINSLPEDEKIIFAPDRNLGGYINRVTGRNMVLWDGACHVHERFAINKLTELKEQYPNAKVLAHPECKKNVIDLADFVGSTQAILNYATDSEEKEFIIATESGILHKMRKNNPDKKFIPLPSIYSSSGENHCGYMRMNTIDKVYYALKDEQPEILIDEELRLKAVKPIERMLELSK